LDVLASLRFQPTKRPQQQNAAALAAKAKAKAIATKLSATSTETVNAPKAPSPPTKLDPPQAKSELSAPKTTLADWTNTVSDDEWNTFGEKRQRGGRKKRKKNKDASTEHTSQNWDAIYDPSRPNNYEEYKHSDEKILEVREWKDLLYRHRMRRAPSSSSESDRPLNREMSQNMPKL
jgi:splicing factor 45